MPVVAVQFLEASPELGNIAPGAVRECLREAFSILPISMVFLGWNLPRPLLEAVVEETAQANVRLYRWQPLLTGDGTFTPRLEWQTIGLDGNPVKGFRGLPEFTFVCPNKPAVQEAVGAHLDQVFSSPFQGIFLDRLRFPSPAEFPASHLACFCEDCRRKIWEQEGLELAELQQTLCVYLQSPETARSARRSLVASLFNCNLPDLPEDLLQGLRAFFRFRTRSICDFVGWVVGLASSKGVGVGLDCFSPSLTHLVGQDLGTLGQLSDWIKVMSYAHAWGPAGLPYELCGLAAFLCEHAQMGEPEALTFLERLAGFGLPDTFRELRRKGISSAGLVAEIKRARASGVRRLFAGLELVEIPGVCELKNKQIRRDWEAVLEAGVDGVVLSWDLWYIPLKRLKLVSDILTKFS